METIAFAENYQYFLFESTVAEELLFRPVSTIQLVSTNKGVTILSNG